MFQNGFNGHPKIMLNDEGIFYIKHKWKLYFDDHQTIKHVERDVYSPSKYSYRRSLDLPSHGRSM